MRTTETKSTWMVWHGTALAGLVLSGFGVTTAAAWPQFRGPTRDGKASQGLALLQSWPEDGPKQQWVSSDLGFGFASASVAEHGIYTTGMEGDTGVLYALDHEGRLRWKTPYGRDWDRGYRGSRTTPTIQDGKLYIMTGYGLAACFDAANGAVIWTVDTVEQFGARNITWGLTESPLVLDGKVIVSPGGETAGVVALDAETGETRWVSADVRDRSGYCSPIVVQRGGQTLIAQLMAKTFVGIEAATGALRWRVDRQPAPSHGIQAVSPVYADGLFYVTSGYGGERGQMYRLSEDGKQITPGWRDAELDCQHGGVVLHNGYLYGAADRNNRNQWICMELSSGRVAATLGGVGKGSVIYADGRLYTYGERGMMGLVIPDPDDFRMVSAFQVQEGDGPHWAHPSIADGRLYLRHGGSLMAYDIRRP